MSHGSTTLGLNSAYLIPGYGEDIADAPSFGRQPLPDWTDEDRTRPAHEPYQGWVSPFGLLADGPLTVTRYIKDILCHRYYTCYGSGCSHLTLAAQCWFEDDFACLYVPSRQIRDYTVRHYRWQEPEVQAAYETVSDGAVTASEIADLADIGKTFQSAYGDWEKIEPTEVQKRRLDRIHKKWTAAAAKLLAFGTADFRPYRWSPGLHADQNMALPPEGAFGYDATNPGAYNAGKQHEPYENTARRMHWSGQGFIAWRKCRNGALDTDEWERIAGAIAAGGTEAENALVHARPLQACDIIVRKHVTLTRKYWRGAVDDRTKKTIGKEAEKEYDITCTWISGARPAAFEGTPYAL